MNLGIGHPETTERMEMAVMRPAMNLRGIRSGDVGEQARNSIQTSATASIGLRLVPAQTPGLPARGRGASYRPIKATWSSTGNRPPMQRAAQDRIAMLDWSEAGYPAYRAPFDLPMAKVHCGDHEPTE